MIKAFLSNKVVTMENMQVISVDEYIKWFGTFTIPFYIKVAIIVGIVTYFAKQWLDSTLRVCNIVKYRIELIKSSKKE